MKKIILGALISVFWLSGCSTIVGMRADAAKFDMRTIGANIDASPMKSVDFKRIKSVVVADYSGLMGNEFPADNKRLYKAAVRELENLLSEKDSYSVMSAKEFRKKIVESDVEIDLTLVDSEELNSELASIGKNLGVDAVVSFGLDAGDATSMGNQFKNMGQLLFKGAIAIAMTAEIDFISSNNSDVLWGQKSKVEWVSGTQGLKTTKNAELRQKLRTVLTPIVNQVN